MFILTKSRTKVLYASQDYVHGFMDGACNHAGQRAFCSGRKLSKGSAALASTSAAAQHDLGRDLGEAEKP